VEDPRDGLARHGELTSCDNRLPGQSDGAVRRTTSAAIGPARSTDVSASRAAEPPLGYIETLAGELFLESSRDLARLSAPYANLKMLAMSPAESVTFIRELSKHAT
jgi:hypothetical protein